MEKVFNKNEIDMVIYHYPCSDGFGAAFSVWKYYKETNNSRSVEYVEANYGKAMPNVKGKNVLITDFSYPIDVMRQIIEESKSVFLIDHHSSAQKNLADLEDKYKIFDMTHSAAVLVWKYMNDETDDEKVPLMMRYIEDRDIWKKELPNNEEFSVWFFTLDMTFEVYEEVYDSPELIKNGIEKGKYYIELNKHIIKTQAKWATPKLVKLSNKKNEEFVFVSHMNSPILKSDIGNYIFNYFPHIDLSAVYTIQEAKRVTGFSLRSTKYHRDVSQISTEYLGGGGHRNASGCAINALTNCISGKEYDIGLYDLITKNLYYGKVKNDNVVYLNSTTNKGVIGKYLLQKKFDLKIKEKDEYKEITNAVSIKSLNKCSEIMDGIWSDAFNQVYETILEDTEEISTSIIWSYDGKYTTYIIQNNDSVKDIIKYINDIHINNLEIIELDDTYCKCKLLGLAILIE
uniref:DHH family phosphohydrolase n=1 Tax=Pithovirus LCPAC101 TaxID=2506586 RepID=A0A481Z4M0_9VIRU|nr:MAG: DHH family phosphohydrolase [Pithovirus LCPAC101]